MLAVRTTTTVGKGSGIRQEFPIAVVATFKDGLETQWKDYGAKERALEAVGLSE